MAKFVLGPNQWIKVIPPDSDEVLKNETILVLLEEFQVRGLFSKDRGDSSREGTPSYIIGQSSDVSLLVTSQKERRRYQEHREIPPLCPVSWKTGRQPGH